MTFNELELVRETYSALERGDVNALLAHASPDIAVFQSDLVPWGGDRARHEGLLMFLQSVMTHLDSKVEVGEMYIAGDTVVQVGRTRGVVRATGRSFDAAETHLWRVRGGQIVAFEAYVDTDELVRALGTDF
ncbi:nuclear transport factor 2 family protein [Glaciibacter flavus]|uniref:nuclear transport factor 2 family protein n=1 Tax=Orlajensenia flava TaxID=2565934 RepID=UPI003AFFEB40